MTTENKPFIKCNDYESIIIILIIFTTICFISFLIYNNEQTESIYDKCLDNCNSYGRADYALSCDNSCNILIYNLSNINLSKKDLQC